MYNNATTTSFGLFMYITIFAENMYQPCNVSSTLHSDFGGYYVLYKISLEKLTNVERKKII